MNHANLPDSFEVGLINQFKGEATARGLRGRTVEDGACCYARSDKLWLADPDGLAWEGFHTRAAHESFGVDDITDAEIRDLRAAVETAGLVGPRALGLDLGRRYNGPLRERSMGPEEPRNGTV